MDKIFSMTINKTGNVFECGMLKTDGDLLSFHATKEEDIIRYITINIKRMKGQI